MQWFRLTVENRRNVTKFQKALSLLAESREYHHTDIYKLVKSTNSPVMHIISVAKALKNISRIYISYTVLKKYKRRMHEKFSSLYRGSYKANLRKMAELDGERNFFQGLILIE